MELFAEFVMLAFQVSVNGHSLCTVSSAQIVSVIATLKEEETVGGSEPPMLEIGGITEPDTHATWVNQTLVKGDRISIAVVDVVASALTAPANIKREISNVVESERRAYYERLKSEYEPSPT